MSDKEIDRQDLMKQLTDASIMWTRDELMGVITQELRKDSPSVRSPNPGCTLLGMSAHGWCRFRAAHW